MNSLLFENLEDRLSLLNKNTLEDGENHYKEAQKYLEALKSQSEKKLDTLRTLDEIYEMKCTKLGNNYISFCGAPWKLIKPYVKERIKIIFGDKNCLNCNMIFYYPVGHDERLEFCLWGCKALEKCQYPKFISCGNHGKYSILELTNNTKALEDSKNANVFNYKYFENKKITDPNIQHLLLRAGFSCDDFEESEYGQKYTVFIKTLEYKDSDPIILCNRIKGDILQVLKEQMEWFVVFIIKLTHKDAKVIDVVSVNDHDLTRTLGESFKLDATIFEGQTMYYSFTNDKREMVDLHRLTKFEAEDEVFEYLSEKYWFMESECILIPGKGNHTNNGTFGVLNKILPEWLKKDEFSWMVESCELCENRGRYLET
jgi:hypothetical protein